jgi:hypothetical protein
MREIEASIVAYLISMFWKIAAFKRVTVICRFQKVGAANSRLVECGVGELCTRKNAGLYRAAGKIRAFKVGICEIANEAAAAKHSATQISACQIVIAVIVIIEINKVPFARRVSFQNVMWFWVTGHNQGFIRGVKLHQCRV